MRMGKRLQRAVAAAALGAALATAGLAAPAIAQEKKDGAPAMLAAEFDQAKRIYFDRCAGCHGVLRKGATGPKLLPADMQKDGTEKLEKVIFEGTVKGMPDWGRQGVLTRDETNLMARYIQQEPPVPPEMSLRQMKDTWKVLVPPDKRPKKPEHTRDWQNFFTVILRDAGQVAIIDGTTKEIVNVVNTGFAVHIARASASGRYMYTIGRDGKATMIDLWMKVPDRVAEVQTCSDARSVDTSKYKGPAGNFHDKYAIVGCYWPPHFAVLNGDTLEPLKIVSTRSYTYDTNEFHQEPRVATIVASHFKPQWIVTIKETGLVWLVDYSDIKNLRITQIETEAFLHDGGWDLSKRYFTVAANQRNKLVVVDAQKEKLEAIIKVGKIPHPGRGANWVDPKFGPVGATVHLGEGKIAVYGTDPAKRKNSAWQVVREIEVLGGGSLFLKTHPKSAWVWNDHALNPDPKVQRSVCVTDKKAPDKTAKCWEVSDGGRAVHLEYNKAGDEVWVSVWKRKDEQSELVVYDDKTLKEKARIKDPRIVTPTGKFNTFNTMKDVY